LLSNLKLSSGHYYTSRIYKLQAFFLKAKQLVRFFFVETDNVFFAVNRRHGDKAVTGNFYALVGVIFVVINVSLFVADLQFVEIFFDFVAPRALFDRINDNHNNLSF